MQILSWRFEWKYGCLIIVTTKLVILARSRMVIGRALRPLFNIMAFFTNVADMLQAKAALKKIYARTLDANSVKATLDEMLARGLPREIYNKYMDEAIEIGLIPVAGRSRVGGRLLTESDILTKEDILRDIQENFEKNLSWYGIG